MWVMDVGEDGFYDVSQCNAGVNPATWASTVGQNFLPNHAVAVSHLAWLRMQMFMTACSYHV